MSSSIGIAFDHHVWATLRLLDTCLGLSQQQLDTSVPGTYGSIIETMRHLVGADARYLEVMSGGGFPPIGEEGMDVRALRAAMERIGATWGSLLAEGLDPEVVIVRHREDGSESHAPMGIRLAQALHHGTDHRSQVCTALTTLGLEPPEIDVWAFAEAQGLLVETPPTT